MAEIEHAPATVVTVDEIQRGWHDLLLRLEQLENERHLLEQENKGLRTLVERVIEHRQKSHGELVLLLTNLVTRLPLNDVGVVVARLVEHNTHCSEVLGALGKGKGEGEMPQPALLKELDQTKRDLVAAIKPLVEDLVRLELPMEKEMLEALATEPASFFSPRTVRACRCFIKGQLPRERIVREFGEAALVLFNDMTTDPKRNPKPKPDEIVLTFKPEFDALLRDNPSLLAGKRPALLELHARVHRAKFGTETWRQQRNAFHKLSFMLELLHYYENQGTEAPDVVFAQRLPALLEQLVVPPGQETLEEKAILQVERLLDFVMLPEHRLMIINNVGKGGGLVRTLKYLLKFRAEKAKDLDEVFPDFVRHLLPAGATAPVAVSSLVALLRLVPAEIQRLVLLAFKSTDRIRREDAHAFAMAVGAELGLKGLEEADKGRLAVPPELEREQAWSGIKELIARRNDPAAIAAAVRERLHAKYDVDELKQSWITLAEADAISFIRVFCALPYRADGKTDPIAHTILQSYVSRLTHEKYASTYHKIVNSLRNMFKAKPDSHTLVNFVALVKWADPEAAQRLTVDIGMIAPAPAR